MAYTRTNWASGEAGGTLVTAARLNNIEDGIEEGITAAGEAAIDAAAGIDAINTKLPPLPYENYTLDRLRRTRAKMAAVATGGSYNTLFIGDSITQGGTSTSPDFESAPAVFDKNMLDAGMRNSGVGLSWPNYAPSSRWTLVGFTAEGPQTGSVRSNAVGSTAKFVSERASTTVQFFYAKANPVFRYRIDGGTWVNSPTTVTNSTEWGNIVVGSLKPAVHTLEFEHMNAGVVRLGAVRAFTSGYLANNAGIGGSSSETWRSDRLWYENGPSVQLIAQGVDTVFIEPMMYNDEVQGITVARHRENMLNILAWAKLIGGSTAPDTDVIVWTPPRRDTATMSESRYQEYVAVHREVALAAGAIYMDTSRVFGTYAQATALTLMSDTVHPSPRGYAMLGNLFSELLLGEGTTVKTQDVWEDTGWVDITLGGAWINFGSVFATPQCRRIGGIVYVRGVVKSGADGAFFTLPDGFRPTVSFIVGTMISAQSAGGPITITAAGGATILGSNAAYTAFNFSFPVG